MHLILLAALSVEDARRLMELGALFGLLGGLAFAVVGVRPASQKIGMLVGGLLLIVGFVLFIVSLHWGGLGK